MARYYPHPRDFICIRENEDELGEQPVTWPQGGYRVPAGKIFVPVSMGSRVFTEGATNLGQALNLFAAISYPGQIDQAFGVAGTDLYGGLIGPGAANFVSDGKFRAGLTSFVRLPVGLCYHEGTEVLVQGGPQADEPDPIVDPPATTDVRLYGFLCDA